MSKGIILIILICLPEFILGQDGNIYPLETPAEPKAIPLGTGEVADQSASET